MLPKVCVGMLVFALLGFTFKSKTDAKTVTGEREKRAATVDEARRALNKMIQSNSFLSTESPPRRSLALRAGVALCENIGKIPIFLLQLKVY